MPILVSTILNTLVEKVLSGTLHEGSTRIVDSSNRGQVTTKALPCQLITFFLTTYAISGAFR